MLKCLCFVVVCLFVCLFVFYIILYFSPFSDLEKYSPGQSPIY